MLQPWLEDFFKQAAAHLLAIFILAYVRSAAISRKWRSSFGSLDASRALK